MVHKAETFEILDNPGMMKRAGKVLRIALPILAAMASQNLVNLVDTAMVGQLGSTALGAVGLASMANWLALAFFNGLGSGVQVIASRRVGEKNPLGAVRALVGALILAGLVLLPLLAIAAHQAESIFGLLTSSDDVAREGTRYLQLRLLSGVFVVANFSYRGYWNGIGKASVYLQTIIAVHAINIAMNYLLIFGKMGLPRLGVTGAGLASAIAVCSGTMIHALSLNRHRRKEGLMSAAYPSWKLIRNVVRFSAPTGLQMVFFACGFVAFFRISETLGTRQLALTNVLANLSLVCALTAMAFGLAAAALVGQQLGARRIARAHRWAVDSAIVGSLILLIPGASFALFPLFWLRLLVGGDPQAWIMGRTPLVIVALAQPWNGLGIVLSQVLIGAGAGRDVMIANIFLQWALFLPAAFLFAVKLGGGLLVLWIGMVSYRAAFALRMLLLFRSGGWARIRV